VARLRLTSSRGCGDSKKNVVALVMLSVRVVVSLLALLALALARGREGYINTNLDQIKKFIERYARSSGGTMTEGEGWLQWTSAVGGTDMFRVFESRNDTHLVRQAVARVKKMFQNATITRIDYLIDERDNIPYVARRNFIYVQFTTPTETHGESLFFLRHNRERSVLKMVNGNWVDNTKTLVPVGLNLSASRSPWIK
jgi:hypothetical protein